MNSPFTEKAEAALNGAVPIAESFGHSYIGSEHMLLSLLENGISCASVLLERNGVTGENVRAAVGDLCGIGDPSVLSPADMTPRCRKILENASHHSHLYGAGKIGTEHILLSILEEKESTAHRVLRRTGTDMISLHDDAVTFLRSTESQTAEGSAVKDKSKSVLLQFGKDMTEAARSDSYDPVIGREKETERLIRILVRKNKNNPCLIGEAGVGKTAIAEGLAERIASGNVPPVLLGKKLIALDLTSMIAGTKYRGDFEERLKSVIAEVRSDPDILLFIDEIHTIVGAGSAEGAIDAANILKPELSRGGLQLIGATTVEEYRKFIEKDPALERRFQPLTVEEPSPEETERILSGLRERYEKHHGVSIEEDAIRACVTLTGRYLQDRRFPDKALDVLDEACAKVQVGSGGTENANLSRSVRELRRSVESAVREKNYPEALLLHEREKELNARLAQNPAGNVSTPPAVTENNVREILAEMTGIPVTGLQSDISAVRLKERLSGRVIGQAEAVGKLADAVSRRLSGVSDPNRPIGVFLFLGESGVGKTELAKALTEELFEDENALIRFDMSEFTESFSVSRLIGSPPGYVGFRESGELTDRVRRRPYSVLLFDEIEKAHPDVHDLLLQLTDEGFLTDSSGRKISFRHCCVIMTSNAGEKRDGAAASPGFRPGEKTETEKDVRSSLREIFRPEFLNRMDEIIRFRSLDPTDMTEIAKRKIAAFGKRMENSGIRLRFSSDVAGFLANEAFREKSGARPIARALATRIETPLADGILREKIRKGDTVTVSVSGEEILLRTVGTKKSDKKATRS